jgi:CBS domain-containing protein
MRRVDEIRSVEPETSAMRAMEIMVGNDVNQMPVVSDHSLKGVISRSSILRILRSRIELNT